MWSDKFYLFYNPSVWIICQSLDSFKWRFVVCTLILTPLTLLFTILRLGKVSRVWPLQLGQKTLLWHVLTQNIKTLYINTLVGSFFVFFCFFVMN